MFNTIDRFQISGAFVPLPRYTDIFCLSRLLLTPKHAYHYLWANVKPGMKECDASSAILKASNFPFRQDSVRVVFLIHHGQVRDGHKKVIHYFSSMIYRQNVLAYKLELQRKTIILIHYNTCTCFVFFRTLFVHCFIIFFFL